MGGGERTEGESLGGFNQSRADTDDAYGVHLASGPRAHALLKFHSRSVTPITEPARPAARTFRFDRSHHASLFRTFDAGSLGECDRSR